MIRISKGKETERRLKMENESHSGRSLKSMNIEQVYDRKRESQVYEHVFDLYFHKNKRSD